MRIVPVVIGVVMLIIGIILEGIYVASSQIAYSGAISPNTYLITGSVLIVIGLLFLFGSRIPKVQTVKP